MSLERLLAAIGDVQSDRNLWIRPIVFREQDRTGAADAATTQAHALLYPGWEAHVGEDGTRLPYDSALARLAESISILRRNGFPDDATALLDFAGEVALRYGTHVTQLTWGQGGTDLYRTGRLTYEGDPAPWADRAVAMYERVASQFARAKAILDPVYQGIWRGETEACGVRDRIATWDKLMDYLERNLPMDDFEHGLVRAVRASLTQFDRAPAERWLTDALNANARSENPNSYVNAVQAAAERFLSAESLQGAQLVAWIGREFVRQTNAVIPDLWNHAATNGKVMLNNQHGESVLYEIGREDHLNTWIAYTSRAEIVSDLTHLHRQLSKRARGETGREILIIATSLLWEGEPEPRSEAILQSRRALRTAIMTSEDLTTTLNEFKQGVVDAWPALGAGEMKELQEIIKQDVQLSPVVAPLRNSPDAAWLFGAEVTVNRAGGVVDSVQIVPPPTPVASVVRR